MIRVLGVWKGLFGSVLSHLSSVNAKMRGGKSRWRESPSAPSQRRCSISLQENNTRFSLRAKILLTSRANLRVSVATLKRDAVLPNAAKLFRFHASLSC